MVAGDITVNHMLMRLLGGDTGRRTRRSAGWRTAVVALLLMVAGTGVPHAQKNTPGALPASHKAHLDGPLADHLGRAGDSDLERVIITLQPGAKHGLLRALRAQGFQAKNDFSVIEAFAGELPRGLLRALQHHPDVVSISTDAAMRPMSLTTSVTGTALNTAHTLRTTLGLDISGAAASRTYQQGDTNAYGSAVDTFVDSLAPWTNYSASTFGWVDSGGTGSPAGALIRFEQLFGAGAGQIRTDPTITSVTLRIGQYADGSATASAGLYRMLVPWSAASTYQSMTTSGVGIQRDNVEAAMSADANISGLSTWGYRTFSGAALTASVQAWANGRRTTGGSCGKPSPTTGGCAPLKMQRWPAGRC